MSFYGFGVVSKATCRSAQSVSSCGNHAATLKKPLPQAIYTPSPTSESLRGDFANVLSIHFIGSDASGSCIARFENSPILLVEPRAL